MVAPGIDFYLAPVIYLWVLRTFGTRAGLAAALATCAPTVLWWGHGYVLAFALLQVVLTGEALRRTAGRVAMVDAAALFALGVTLPLGFALMVGIYAPEAWATELILISAVANNLFGASLVDVFSTNFRLDRGSLTLVARRPVRLGVWLRSMVHAVLALAFLGGATVGGQRFWLHIADQRELDREAVFAQIRLSPPPAPGQPRRIAIERLKGSGPIKAAYGTAGADLGMGSPAARGLGCSSVVQQRTPSDPIRDIGRFEDLVGRCELTTPPEIDGALQVLIPLKSAATLVFQRAVLYLALAGSVVIMFSILALLFAQALDRTLERWPRIIELLGTSGLAAGPISRFTDFEQPAQRIVAANNRFVNALREREAAQNVIVELHERLGLRSVLNVIVGPDGTWVEFDGRATPEPGRVRVPAQITGPKNSARDPGSAILEVYLGDAPGEGWHQLLLGPRLADGCYGEALMAPLREPSAVLHVLAQRQRLSSIGQNVAMVAHELRQPLFLTRLVTERMRLRLEPLDGDTPAALRRDVDQLEQGLERAQDMILKLTASVRTDLDEMPDCDPVALIEQLMRAKQNVALELETRMGMESRLPPDYRVAVSEATLSQIAANLVDNALDAIRERQAKLRSGAGEVRLSLDLTPSGAVQLECRDDGCGMPEAVGGQSVFNAFVTTKRRGKGTGLGLYVVQRLVRRAGGQITVESQPGEGTNFRVTLPGLTPARGAERAPEA